MAKQIKRSEIAEKDLYQDIRQSAIETIEHIEYLNETLKDTAQVINKNLKKPLESTLDSINSLNTGVEAMNNTMEQSVKLDKAKSEALKTQYKAEQELEKLKQQEIKTEEQLIKLMKQELALEVKEQQQLQKTLKAKEQNKRLTDQEITDKIKAQRLAQERKKALTDELILQDKSAGTLEKLSAQSRKLRRERAKLNLETVEGKKRLKEINEELDENNDVIKENSDALKKQKLNVGNYADSLAGATGELGGLIKGVKDSIDGIKAQAKAFMLQGKAADTSAKKLRLVGKALKATGIGLIIALLGSLVASFGDTREEAQMMGNTLKKITGSIKLIGSAVRGFFENFGLKWEAFQLKMELGIANIKNLFGGYDDEVTALLKRQAEVNKQIEKNATIKVDLSSFADMSTAIDNITRQTYLLENAMAITNQEIEKLRGEEELLSEKTGDMTLSFRDQLQAQNEYNKVVEKRVGLEKQLAEQNVDLQAEKIRLSLIQAGREYSIEQIKNLEFLQAEADWVKINSDNLNELADAKVSVTEKENELNTLQAKNAMERRNTLKDLFEKELDYAIDAFDVQKTINERVINDERTTLAEREALTEETRRLAESSFENQIGLVNGYTKQKIDFESLSKMTDEAEIRRTLKKNNLNETTLTRILEIIKERKLVEQDLADLENENNAKRLAMLKEINTSKQNIEQDDFDLSIELLEKEFDTERELRTESLEDEKIKGAESIKQLKARLDQIRDIKVKQLKDQAQFEKDALNLEVMEEEERAQKKEEIDRKLANDIIRLDQEVLDEKKEIDKEEAEHKKKTEEEAREDAKKRVDEQIAMLQMLTEVANDLADKRIAKIDEEIQASQERFSTYQELAKNGNILASQSMAEEQKIMADAQRQKEKMERNKQRMALASSVLQTYLTNSQDETVENPLAKTITDTVLLTEFIKSLPTFLDGTENTGSHGQGVDGKGGFHSILHPNERVLTKEQNRKIGGLSNNELSDLAHNYHTGLVRDISDGVIVSNGLTGTNLLIDKLSSLEDTIRNKPESNIELEQIIDGAMAITRTTRKGNTKIYNRYRV